MRCGGRAWRRYASSLLASSEQEPGVVGIGSGGDDVPLARDGAMRGIENVDAPSPVKLPPHRGPTKNRSTP